ncbi:hypothetical protein [Caballeronia glathei]|nr:hypothetical protein [Caballeronia glathei]
MTRRVSIKKIVTYFRQLSKQRKRLSLVPGSLTVKGCLCLLRSTS